MSCLLAIDQSTSATKALLVDVAVNVLDTHSIEHQQHYPQPGWVEHDANEIWENLIQAVRELVSRNDQRASELQGVSITNQRETVVVFDRETGAPIAPAIVWQCRRSDDICSEMRAAGHESLIHSSTGLKLDAYFSASKLTWLMRERPEIAEQLRSGQALIGTIDTYLIYRLTGGKVFATDHTNASRTLLFDIKRLGWNDQLCELFGVPSIALAEVRESFAEFGQTDFEGALPQSLPICGVMGDSQASLFAQRCFDPGDAKATFGTGTSVLLNIGNQLKLPENGAVAALAWVHQGTPTYAWEGLINYSAATIAWLRDQLGLIDSAAESETLAASVEDCGGVYLVPAFSGLGAPHWRPDARAAIVGMTAYTNRAHISRAALESIAFQISDVLALLEASGVCPDRLNVDGGPTRNSLLMQLVADIVQLEIHVSEAPESSALGAATAGMIGLGLVPSLTDLKQQKLSQHTFQPCRPQSEADQLRMGWQQAVQRVL